MLVRNILPPCLIAVENNKILLNCGVQRLLSDILAAI